MSAEETEDELLPCEVCGALWRLLVNGMCRRCDASVVVLDAKEARALGTLISVFAIDDMANGGAVSSELLETLAPVTRRFYHQKPSVERTAQLLRTAAQELERVPLELRSARRPLFGGVGTELSVNPKTLRDEADFMVQAARRTATVLERVEP